MTLRRVRIRTVLIAVAVAAVSLSIAADVAWRYVQFMRRSELAGRRELLQVIVLDGNTWLRDAKLRRPDGSWRYSERTRNQMLDSAEWCRESLGRYQDKDLLSIPASEVSQLRREWLARARAIEDMREAERH